MRPLIPMAVLAMCFGSCASDGPDSSRQSVTAEDQVAAVAAAIDVRTDGCGPRIGYGTGAVIGNGDIVTAAHVVAGATDVEVIDVGGQRSAATVILFDPALDFAVLRPDATVGTPLAVRSDEARLDETGIVVLPRLIDGEVEVEIAEVRVIRTVNIATTDIYRDADVTRPGFEIEATIDPGDSGAMVVLPGGGAGIVWARSSQTSQRAWAIDLPAGIRDGSAPPSDAPAVDVGPCPP